MRPRIVTAVLCMAMLAMLPGSSHAIFTGIYSVYELPTPPGTRNSRPVAINGAGQVLGEFTVDVPLETIWVVWDAGPTSGYLTLPSLGLESVAYDMNDSGIVVGNRRDATGRLVGFWAQPPDYVLRDANEGLPPYSIIQVTGVSGHKTLGHPDIITETPEGPSLARWGCGVLPPYACGYIYSSYYLPPTRSGFANALNDDAFPMVTGFVSTELGFHAYRYESETDTFVDLDEGVTGSFGEGTDINNLGEVVGERDNVARIWFKAGGSLPLYLPPSYDHLYDYRSGALGINDAGRVVGYGETSDPSVPRSGFLFNPITNRVDHLAYHIDPTSNWVITSGIGINDRDQIIAIGQTERKTSCDGVPCPYFALLLSPCGDKNVDPGEECDDGNNVGGDGCSAYCKWENRCPADCNGDTVVNALDLQYMVNTILGFGGFVCDPNHDTKFNALDLQLVVNCLLDLPGNVCGECQ